MTNLSLARMREVSGAFISESIFQVIEMEYKDYLKDNSYQDNEDVAEQFIEKWIEEQELLGTFSVTKDGNIKYYCMDGAEEVQLTTSEFLNDLDMNSYHWENMCRSYWAVFKEILDTGNVDQTLLSNILKDTTISHDQIYELLKAMKNRFEELLG